MALSDTWKDVASTLEKEIVPHLPPLVGTALNLMVQLASLTYRVLEAQGVCRKNQQLVEQLSERALIVSRMIELSVAQSRDRDSAFTAFVSSFRTTIEDVLLFVQKFEQQRWIEKFVSSDEVKSQSADLWRRLDALAADYRSYLLKNYLLKGPSERIEHPQMRDFWSLSMHNAFEAKWVHFWDQLQYEYPALRPFLSGPLASHNKGKLQEKALGDQAYERRKVGPLEINNLFQPPNTPVEQIIGSLLDGQSKRSVTSLVIAKATRTPKQQKICIGTTTEARELQCWTGYWTRGCYTGVMTVELLVAANRRIIGGGSDEIGEFTCTGETRGTSVRFMKQYIGQHYVAYDGALQDSTINGTWTKDIGASRKGAFRLEQQMGWRTVAIPREIGILQVGKMQVWSGYYMKGGNKLTTQADMVFTDTNKIYGGGEDSVGRFSWLGRFHPRLSSHSILLNITKQYDAGYVVYYMGAVSSLSVGQDPKVVMEGSWVSSNKLQQGTFCLQPEVNNF